MFRSNSWGLSVINNFNKGTYHVQRFSRLLMPIRKSYLSSIRHILLHIMCISFRSSTSTTTLYSFLLLQHNSKNTVNLPLPSPAGRAARCLRGRRTSNKIALRSQGPQRTTAAASPSRRWCICTAARKEDDETPNLWFSSFFCGIKYLFSCIYFVFWPDRLLLFLLASCTD